MATYFNWGGLSSQTFDIVVNRLPDIIRPAQRMIETIVPGRSGVMRAFDGGYEQVIRACECTAMRNANMDNIAAWLMGASQVIFSNQPDRYYKAVLANQIPFAQVMRGNPHRGFILQFACEPFGYKTGVNKIELTSAGDIVNPCNFESTPKISVWGSGDIILNIGSQQVFISALGSYIIIDSELMDAYDNTALANNKMSGDFPTLPVGTTSISWVGTVSKIEIEPNWRWLS